MARSNWMLGGLLVLSAAMIAGPALAAEPVTSVPQLDISRYAGQWYEIAHLPMRYQKDCVGDITANYSIDMPDRVGVRNTCRTADGKTQVAEGVAHPVQGHPGRLKVSFAPSWLSWVPFVWADYWVIALDPEYQWAVVGEPDRDYLWILSRSPTMERARFEELKARAVAMGYDLKPLIVAAPVQ